MPIVNVSDGGRIVTAAAIRRPLGIIAGSRLGFTLEGETTRPELRQRVPSGHPEGRMLAEPRSCSSRSASSSN